MKKKTPEEHVLDIKNSCEALGWDIAMEDASKIRGLIIGFAPFVEEVTEQLDNGDDFDIWTSPADEKSKLH